MDLPGMRPDGVWAAAQHGLHMPRRPASRSASRNVCLSQRDKCDVGLPSRRFNNMDEGFAALIALCPAMKSLPLDRKKAGSIRHVSSVKLLRTPSVKRTSTTVDDSGLAASEAVTYSFRNRFRLQEGDQLDADVPEITLPDSTDDGLVILWPVLREVGTSKGGIFAVEITKEAPWFPRRTSSYWKVVVTPIWTRRSRRGASGVNT